MKTRPSRRQTAKVSHSRWLAYATAGAATALAGSNTAEAAIHYSGRLEVVFPRHEDTRHYFPLDGASLFFYHTFFSSGGYSFNSVYFDIGPGSFRGTCSIQCFRASVSKLSFGQRIPVGGFVDPIYFGYMASSGGRGQWSDPGVGFIGFRFNSGAGDQYGWARVRMGGVQKGNRFKLIDYAYADPGESIRAGQDGIRADEDGQNMSAEPGLDEGSLGGLALGAVGLLAWRKSRSKTARQTRPPLPL